VKAGNLADNLVGRHFVCRDVEVGEELIQGIRFASVFRSSSSKGRFAGEYNNPLLVSSAFTLWNKNAIYRKKSAP
jgi:hypothetical protein